MKKSIFWLSILSFFISCGNLSNLRNFFKDEVSIGEVIAKKKEIDKSDNPAYKYSVTKELTEKLIKINNVVVKDITVSSNIDYNFCVIISVPHEVGDIECYIYARNNMYSKEDIQTVSRLVKKKSKIDVIGEFSRFFTLLDETYTKIEIINARIKIKEDK